MHLGFDNWKDMIRLSPTYIFHTKRSKNDIYEVLQEKVWENHPSSQGIAIASLPILSFVGEVKENGFEIKRISKHDRGTGFRFRPHIKGLFINTSDVFTSIELKLILHPFELFFMFVGILYLFLWLAVIITL